MAKIQNKSVAKKQLSIFEIPDSIIPVDKRIFYPDWANSPPNAETCITFNEKRVLTTGNIMTIVSRPGTGKTSTVCSIISSHINRDCDSLGFSVSLNGSRNKILYLDTEQSLQDTWGNWRKTLQRAGLEKPETDKRIIFVNIKAISIKDRMKFVEIIMVKNPDIGLIIFDGAGDFLMDTNSIPETCGFIDWINTFNPAISIVTSLHTNPETDKPRGHIGSELCRRAESVLLIRKIENGVREITSEFQHGKVRGDDDRLNSFFSYNTKADMFVSADYKKPQVKNVERKEKYLQLAIELFNGKTECSYSYLIDRIMNKKLVTETGAKHTLLTTLIKEHKIIKKNGNGYVFEV